VTKISSLTALLGADVAPSDDLLTIVDMSETGAARNKKITVAELLSSMTVDLTDLLDDSAGDGITDKTWSVDKIIDAIYTALTGVAETARDALGAALVAGTGISISVNDAGDTITISRTAITESLVLAVSDETTALTTGVAKVTFRMPYAFTVTAVRASLSTAQATGSIIQFDINEGGASILSTKLTIDNGEKTSVTAATAAVISDASLADDAEITIDIDVVGDGTAKGAKIYLIGHQ